MYKIFYRPSEPNSAAADFIPFFDDGIFHLFYLFDHRNNEKYGEGVTWNKIETKDFLNFKDKGEILKKGSKADYDMYCFTGSIIKHQKTYHMFYTGHNTYIKTFGYQNEVVMHAISEDLDHWTKIPEDTFYAPKGYEHCDFRDPFVYYDEKDNLFYMLLCVRKEKDTALRNGETIRMKSTDLKTWKMDKSIYSPHAYQTHECPDLFKIGKNWYLIFSEYSDRNVTCYRTSKSPIGPWSKPNNDTFDGRAFYAAKTATDGKKRYLFGWIPTRMNNKDNGNWMWGGNLIVHEIYTKKNKELFVRPPQSILNAFTEEVLTKSLLSISNLHGCEVTTIYHNLPSTHLFSCIAIPSAKCDRFGILIRQNATLDKAYEFRFDLASGLLYINHFPCFPQNEFLNYQLQRKLKKASKYHITLIADDDVYVLYVNDEMALSFRAYESFGNDLGLYVCDGKALFKDLQLKKIE